MDNSLGMNVFYNLKEVYISFVKNLLFLRHVCNDKIILCRPKLLTTTKII